MMFRPLKLLVVVILVSIFVFANVSNQKVEIKKGESAYIDGKNITIISISKDGGVIIDVDGQRDKIKKGLSDTISGVDISIIDVYDTDSAVLNVSTNFTCGNNICELSEDSKICCKDCNCSKGFFCSLNKCLDESKTDCQTNSDCNDKNKCTIDICSNITKICTNDPIKKCANDDLCCPFGCTKNTDNDCKLNSCSSDQDCDDKNKCTSNKCVDGICKFEGQECEYNGQCNPIGIVMNNTYCFEKRWLPLKNINITCKNDYECKFNICSDGKCGDTNNVVAKKFKTEVSSYAYIAMSLLVLIIIIEIIVLIRKKS